MRIRNWRNSHEVPGTDARYRPSKGRWLTNGSLPHSGVPGWGSLFCRTAVVGSTPTTSTRSIAHEGR
jgi:hypothetical protein